MKQTILIFLFPWILMAQTEEQSYELIETRSNFEIRYYPPVMMVEYDSNESGSSGFRSLFRYISGSNNEEIKIAMTTPVHMEKKEGKSSMAFVLPKKFDPSSRTNEEWEQGEEIPLDSIYVNPNGGVELY